MDNEYISENDMDVEINNSFDHVGNEEKDQEKL